VLPLLLRWHAILLGIQPTVRRLQVAVLLRWLQMELVLVLLLVLRRQHVQKVCL
jgi:hypothetical protein